MLLIPFSFAAFTIIAYAGAVVSNPTAATTYVICGFSAAFSSASNGEYIMFIFTFPFPLASERLPLLPGTFIISPNVSRTWFSFEAYSMHLSIYAVGVTHTGHPGPDISLILSEMRLLIPLLNIAAVCVPQTSISFTGLPSYDCR